MRVVEAMAEGDVAATAVATAAVATVAAMAAAERVAAMAVAEKAAAAMAVASVQYTRQSRRGQGGTYPGRSSAV